MKSSLPKPAAAMSGKIVTVGGAIGFGGSLLLIIGTLLAVYPCANLTPTSKEPFVCRHLDGFGTLVTVLSVIARLALLAMAIGGIMWAVQSSRKDRQ